MPEATDASLEIALPAQESKMLPETAGTHQGET